MSDRENEGVSGAAATVEADPSTQVDSSEQLGDPPADDPTAERDGDDDTESLAEGQLPAQLPEGWQDHEEIKAHGQTKYNEGRGTREKELRKEMDRREGRQTADLQQAAERGTASEVVQAALRIATDGLDLTDPDGVTTFNKFLRDNSRWADVFIGAQASAAEARTIKEARNFIMDDSGLSDEVVGTLKDLESDLVWKVRHKELTQGEALRDLVTASIKHFKALGAAEAVEERDKKDREMSDAEARANEHREGGSPPAAPRGGGGKRRAVTMADIKKMDRAQVMKIPKKEREAAMTRG